MLFVTSPSGLARVNQLSRKLKEYTLSDIKRYKWIR